MIPAIFINCSDRPYIDSIMNSTKKYETRTRNTLKALLSWSLGERVLLVETGHGIPVVRCSAVIDRITEVYCEDTWKKYVKDADILPGGKYDWKPDTKKKVLYHLTDVQPVKPFAPEGKRHGRTWMECTNAPRAMSNSDRLETIGRFIDIFEDFLEEKGVEIPNDEKDQDDDAANIYGTDYGILESRIESLLIDLGVL